MRLKHLKFQQHFSPHACTEIRYSSKPQLSEPVESNFKPLTKEELKWAQEVVGTFMFYTRAVNPTMYPAVGSIATALHSNSFKTLKKKIDQLLDYASTHPNASIKYVASKMHLWALMEI